VTLFKKRGTKWRRTDQNQRKRSSEARTKTARRPPFGNCRGRENEEAEVRNVNIPKRRGGEVQKYRRTAGRGGRGVEWTFHKESPYQRAEGEKELAIRNHQGGGIQIESWDGTKTHLGERKATREAKDVQIG